MLKESQMTTVQLQEPAYIKSGLMKKYIVGKFIGPVNRLLYLRKTDCSGHLPIVLVYLFYIDDSYGSALVLLE